MDDLLSLIVGLNEKGFAITFSPLYFSPLYRTEGTQRLIEKNIIRIKMERGNLQIERMVDKMDCSRSYSYTVNMHLERMANEIGAREHNDRMSKIFDEPEKKERPTDYPGLGLHNSQY